MTELECPICMEVGLDLYTPSVCKHYSCKSCLERTSKNAEDEVLCPQCRRPFKVEEIVRFVPPPTNMSYCLDLLCSKSSGCKKVHIDDLFPDPPKYTPPPKPEPAPEPAEPEFVIPEGATYCCDILCPGGSKATCGKRHESDFFVNLTK